MTKGKRHKLHKRKEKICARFKDGKVCGQKFLGGSNSKYCYDCKEI